MNLENINQDDAGLWHPQINILGETQDLGSFEHQFDALAARHQAELDHGFWPGMPDLSLEQRTAVRDYMVQLHSLYGEEMERRTASQVCGVERQKKILRGRLMDIYFASRGWQAADKYYSLDMLARRARQLLRRQGKTPPAWSTPRNTPWCDHSAFAVLRGGSEGRRLAAMVSQPYPERLDEYGCKTMADRVAYTRENVGPLFKVSAPDFPSWYYPNRSILLVLEPALPHNTPHG